MAANKVLNTSNALYGNIVRALSGDTVRHKLAALKGGVDTLEQPLEAASATTAEPTATWTAQQGIARNASNWFGISLSSIRKYDLSSNLIATNSSPFAGLPAGLDHCGGSFVDGNYLYVAVSNYSAGSATEKGIAKYLIASATLELDSYIDLVAHTALNASGCCLSIDGTEILVSSFYITAGSDPRNTDLYRLDKTTGAFLGIVQLDTPVTGIQGLDSDGTGLFYVASHTGGGGYIYAYDSNFDIVNIIKPSVNTPEMEDVCFYGGSLYYHVLNGSPRSLTLPYTPTSSTDSMFLSKVGQDGDPVQFLDNILIGDSVSIVFKVTPKTLYNYNTLFDNMSTGNDWESWIYADGRMGYRVLSTSSIVSPIGSIVAGTEYTIAVTWENIAGTVTTKLNIDGVPIGTNSGSWITPPTLGLWLGGANSGNTQGDTSYKDILVFDKVLSDAELADSFTNFDSFYSAIDARQIDQGFTRLGSLTAPAVTGSAGELPTLVKYEDFTSTMLASLDSGGGDLRFSSDLAGTTQLACEVVTFTKATGDVVWVKVPSVSNGALIYVWGDNTGAAQPAVGAAFGRNAVWSDYALRNHFSTASPLIDSTGLATLTPTNVTYGTGIIGGSVVSDGSTSTIDTGQTYSLGTGDFSFSAWIKIPASSAAETVRVVFGNDPGVNFNSNWMFFVRLGTLSLYTVNNSNVTNVVGTTSVADDAWHYITATRSGTSHNVYIDGVLDASNTGTVRSINDTITEGYFEEAYNGWEKLLGDLDEGALLKSAVPAAQLLIEYDNQSATGAWWTAADAGGGGTVGTITQSTASFAQSLSGSVVNSYSGSIDQSTASFSQSAIGSVVIPAITGTIALSVASFAQSLSGNVVSSAVSGNITQTLSVFSQSLAGNTVLPGVVGVITQSTPAFTQSLVGSTAEQIAGVITQSTSRFTQSLVGSIPASWIDKPAASTAWSDNAAAVTVWTDK